MEESHFKKSALGLGLFIMLISTWGVCCLFTVHMQEKSKRCCNSSKLISALKLTLGHRIDTVNHKLQKSLMKTGSRMHGWYTIYLALTVGSLAHSTKNEHFQLNNFRCHRGEYFGKVWR